MGITAAYLLDTNIVSELARRTPDPEILGHVARHQLACAIGSPTIEELAYGINRLPPCSKRTMLERWLEGVASQFILLPYDPKSALWLGRERARLESAGTPAPRTDGEIASIAATHGLILVTRNTRDFRHFSGLRVENWFSQ